MYALINSRTYLDWGLTSDWKVTGPRRQLAQGTSAAQSVAHGASEGASSLPFSARWLKKHWSLAFGRPSCALPAQSRCRGRTRHRVRGDDRGLDPADAGKAADPGKQRPRSFRHANHSRLQYPHLLLVLRDVTLLADAHSATEAPPDVSVYIHRRRVWLRQGAVPTSQPRTCLCGLVSIQTAAPSPTRQVVLHAAISTDVARTVGIEMVASRHGQAEGVLADLRAGNCCKRVNPQSCMLPSPSLAGRRSPSFAPSLDVHCPGRCPPWPQNRLCCGWVDNAAAA